MARHVCDGWREWVIVYFFRTWKRRERKKSCTPFSSSGILHYSWESKGQWKQSRWSSKQYGASFVLWLHGVVIRVIDKFMLFHLVCAADINKWAYKQVMSLQLVAKHMHERLTLLRINLHCWLTGSNQKKRNVSSVIGVCWRTACYLQNDPWPTHRNSASVLWCHVPIVPGRINCTGIPFSAG